MVNRKQESDEKMDIGLIPPVVTPDFYRINQKFDGSASVNILHDIKLPEEGEWIPLF